MVPQAELEPGERVVDSFHAARTTYWRDHAWMAAGAMALGMVVLWAIGNPHVWTGAVGGLAAIAVRAGYLASDEVKARWDLTDRRLLGPLGKQAWLREIAQLRVLGSAVQIVTTEGDKHLIKYLADRDAVKTRIDAAVAGAMA
ncbi:hypothetical protein FIU89_02525 [Roseovarius sp. THAF27]|nr:MULTISPECIES: hypothetical protein [unclassified Roseovarius]QFT79471.1 hypothetical protein FIU89_02525 [Roseovarius sp. THAF27]